MTSKSNYLCYLEYGLLLSKLYDLKGYGSYIKINSLKLINVSSMNKIL